MLVYYYTGRIQGERPHYEPPKLVVRQIDGKNFYWNYQQQRWVRFTKRCPYLV